MTFSKLLTIVIPTYNMEQFLPQCLDSITREDVPDSLEAIIVNDGSTDNSLEIAKRYQAKRPDIIRIIDKPNGHYGSCINAALKIATGKYFRPLDADDWFDTDALLEFLDKIRQIDTDLIITPRQEHDNGKTRTFGLQDSAFLNSHSIHVLKKQSLDKLNGILSMHSMTFKRSLLNGLCLNLQEGICYTDTEYYFIPLSQSKDFSYINTPLYQYRRGREGQSMEQKNFIQNRHHFALVLKKILQESSLDSLLEYEKITELLQRLFNIELFQCPRNAGDDLDMQEIYHIIMQKKPGIWRSLNKKMYFSPTLWLHLRISFFSYTQIKHFLGIQNILPSIK